jgi:PAS domain S-box-containing protein
MKTQLEYNRNFFQSSPSVLDQRLGSDNVTAVSSTQRQQQQSTQPIDTDPLPRTLQDALRPCKSRSIVITEKYAPFRIVNVNSCWEQLCGYSYIESKGKTLGSLLRGPQTDPLTATTMIAKLLQGEDDVGATLINYKKDGQAFYNRIRAGPLFDEETGDISHFVGLLQEIGNVTTSSDSHNANGYESSLSNDESKKQNVYA